MSSVLAAIGAFIGSILKYIIPALFREGRKPREAKPAGFDEDLQNDIEKSIDEQNK